MLNVINQNRQGTLSTANNYLSNEFSAVAERPVQRLESAEGTTLVAKQTSLVKRKEVKRKYTIGYQGL
jgi:hypothetical protein